MSKKKKAHESNPAVVNAPAPLEPTRTLGLMLLLLSIVFTVVWLTRESIENSQATADTNAVEYSVVEPLSGFNSDNWYLPEDDLFGFVEIPQGTFTMGSNPSVDRMAYENERWSNLQRQGQVTEPTFYISRFETTVAQYSVYLADTGQDAPTGTAAQTMNLQAPARFPIVGITWPEALAYARWLSEKMQTSTELPQELKAFFENGARVTLPTEAQWEKAARGTDGRVFPWGSRVRSDVANFNNDRLLAVGALPCDSCSYGLSDMAGNVWEMTRSPLQDYPYSVDDDLQNLGEEALWVMRGGSYSDQINNVRTAVRGGVDPSVRNSTIGFRLVISLPY